MPSRSVLQKRVGKYYLGRTIGEVSEKGALQVAQEAWCGSGCILLAWRRPSTGLVPVPARLHHLIMDGYVG